MVRKRSNLNKRKTRQNAYCRKSFKRFIEKVKDSTIVKLSEMNEGAIDLQMNTDIHDVMSKILSRICRLELERKR